MKTGILHEERAQGSVEVLIALGIAVLAAITVGAWVKNIVTERAQPEISSRT